jgi:small subunit ribosomal protein S11
MAIAYVLSTNNNISITIKTHKKKVFTWITAGSYGYKNTQKSTPYAAEATAKGVGRFLKWSNRINNIIIKVKGFGRGRRTMIKGFKFARLAIFKLDYITPIAHNGCRKKKKRRL